MERKDADQYNNQGKLMNLIQYALLKINEESGEIADALITGFDFTSDLQFLENKEEIKKEVNDLNAVIEKMRKDFDFYFFNFCPLDCEQFKIKHSDKDLSFWVMYTIKASINVSKIASKCIQFGLKEKQSDLSLNNNDRLGYALRELFFGIECLNDFGLEYKLDRDHIDCKIKKIDHYLGYSIDLKCVNTDPIHPELVPERMTVVVDEFGYLGKVSLFK